MRSAGYHEKMIERTYFAGDQVTQLNLVLYNTIKWPYQPKHSTSFHCGPMVEITRGWNRPLVELVNIIFLNM